jgi:hypothetical protein
VPLLVEATVQTALTVSPSYLGLGTVQLNAPLIRRVQVRGAQPFRVLGVDGLGDGVALGAPLSTTESSVQTVTFRCEFTSAGAVKRELKLRTSLQDAPVVVTIDAMPSP